MHINEYINIHCKPPLSVTLLESDMSVSYTQGVGFTCIVIQFQEGVGCRKELCNHKINTRRTIDRLLDASTMSVRNALSHA